ncbi:MAG TPA: heme o synthase [Chitinophagaceae bacterium]|nr:heme o synthase [Chitinophagaceae bacterium]
MNNVATSVSNSASFAIASKAKDYFQLMKFTLSFTVVFSCVVSYLLVPGIQFNFISVLEMFVAGMLITGSANAINQILERNTDTLMRRTSGRPLAAKRMQPGEAWMFAVIAGIGGIALMALWFNVLSAATALISLVLYGFIYTPLKKISSIAVLVGALPGALPCLTGWAAGANTLSAPGWVLFGIQFLWQFPHFWAIAWVAYRDYEKAGFKLLPAHEGPTKFSALQCIIYSMLMIPVGMLPYYFHLSGQISFWILLACNFSMVFLSIVLFIKMTTAAARRMMFGSYFYLVIVFLALLFDKI